MELMAGSAVTLDDVCDMSVRAHVQSVQSVRR
jgi:hypothetical protein